MKSCFLTSSTLLRVYVLLWVMMINPSTSVDQHLLAVKVVKAPVTARQTVHVNQADFFPLLRKLETVSYPVIMWNIIAWDFSACRLFTIAWVVMWKKWLPMPKLIQSSSVCPSWKWLTDLMTTAQSTVWIATFIISWSTMNNMEEYTSVHFLLSTQVKAFNVSQLVVSRHDDNSSCVLRRTFPWASHNCVHSAR